MASRILGMGDVGHLVEKAQQTFAVEDMQRMEARMQKNNFDLMIFLSSCGSSKKMGPSKICSKCSPCGGQVPQKMKDGLSAGFSEKEMKKTEAIILSMTPRERRRPELIAAARKRRIARGSGTQVQDVNDLLRNFDRARKMMKMLKKMQKRVAPLWKVGYRATFFFRTRDGLCRSVGFGIAITDRGAYAKGMIRWQ